MAFTKSADGIAHKGKTKGKNLGDSGAHLSVQKGGKGGKGGKTNDEMKTLGRGMAKVANQMRG
jgi:hypothetical protein